MKHTQYIYHCKPGKLLFTFLPPKMQYIWQKRNKKKMTTGLLSFTPCLFIPLCHPTVWGSLHCSPLRLQELFSATQTRVLRKQNKTKQQKPHTDCHFANQQEVCQRISGAISLGILLNSDVVTKWLVTGYFWSSRPLHGLPLEPLKHEMFALIFIPVLHGTFNASNKII